MRMAFGIKLPSSNKLRCYYNWQKQLVFLTSFPEYWLPKGSAQSLTKLQILLMPRSQNDIELHLKDVEKRGSE